MAGCEIEPDRLGCAEAAIYGCIALVLGIAFLPFTLIWVVYQHLRGD